MGTKISVEVAYATREKQSIMTIEVNEGVTIESAIRLSGILDLFTEIDLGKNKVGVFSEVRELSDIVIEGDRIEIYRDLIIDPKEARRLKAKKRK